VPAIHETAYPRLKSSISDTDLKEVYYPAAEEISLAERSTKRSTRLHFLLLLKTFDLFVAHSYTIENQA
jgi:hypothetical protein